MHNNSNFILIYNIIFMIIKKKSFNPKKAAIYDDHMQHFYSVPIVTK